MACGFLNYSLSRCDLVLCAIGLRCCPVERVAYLMVHRGSFGCRLFEFEFLFLDCIFESLFEFIILVCHYLQSSRWFIISIYWCSVLTTTNLQRSVLSLLHACLLIKMPKPNKPPAWVTPHWVPRPSDDESRYKRKSMFLMSGVGYQICFIFWGTVFIYFPVR